MTKGYEESERSQLRITLGNMLKQLLDENPELHYFQGLHDIASGFILVLGYPLALTATENVCKHYIKYYIYY